MDNVIQEKVNQWLTGNYDQETKDAIIKMQAENPPNLPKVFIKV